MTREQTKRKGQVKKEEDQGAESGSAHFNFLSAAVTLLFFGVTAAPSIKCTKVNIFGVRCLVLMAIVYVCMHTWADPDQYDDCGSEYTQIN
jgi:hypothetical protein